MTSKQMHLRRKYINQTLTLPGSGFSNQGSESALSPPTSLLIQLVSICPGSQPAASQRGARQLQLPCPLLPNRLQKAQSSSLSSAWRRAASRPGAGEREELRTADNSRRFQPLRFLAPAQAQVQTSPSHTSPHLEPGPCQLHTPVGGFPTF